MAINILPRGQNLLKVRKNFLLNVFHNLWLRYIPTNESTKYKCDYSHYFSFSGASGGIRTRVNYSPSGWKPDALTPELRTLAFYLLLNVIQIIIKLHNSQKNHYN